MFAARKILKMQSQKRAREDALTSESAASSPAAKRSKAESSQSANSTPALAANTELNLHGYNPSKAPKVDQITEVQKHFLVKIMRNIKKIKSGFWFTKPLGEATHSSGDQDRIKQPIDLTIIESTLRRDPYSSADDLTADLELMIANTFLSKGINSAVSISAVSLRAHSCKNMKDYPDSVPKPMKKKMMMKKKVQRYSSDSESDMDPSPMNKIGSTLFAQKNNPTPTQQAVKKKLHNHGSIRPKVMQKIKLEETLTQTPANQIKPSSAESVATAMTSLKGPLIPPPAPAPKKSAGSYAPASKQAVKKTFEPEATLAKIARLKKIIADAQAEITASEQKGKLEEELRALEISREQADTQIARTGHNHRDLERELEDLKNETLGVGIELERFRAKRLEIIAEQDALKKKIKEIDESGSKVAS